MTKTELIFAIVFLAALFALVVGGLLHSAARGDEMMEDFNAKPQRHEEEKL